MQNIFPILQGQHHGGAFRARIELCDLLPQTTGLLRENRIIASVVRHDGNFVVPVSVEIDQKRIAMHKLRPQTGWQQEIRPRSNTESSRATTRPRCGGIMPSSSMIIGISAREQREHKRAGMRDQCPMIPACPGASFAGVATILDVFRARLIVRQLRRNMADKSAH